MPARFQPRNPIRLSQQRPKTVIFHPRAELYRTLLGEAGADAELRAMTDEAQLGEAIADADILITLACPPVVIERGRALRWIQTVSSGVDTLLPHRAALRDVIVTNARGIHVDQIGDYAMTAMLMLQWDLPRMLRSQAARRWDRDAKMPLAGRTLGIIGLGAVAQGVVRRALASEMEVIGLSRSGAPVAGVSSVYTPDRLHAMLPRCDFVLLIVPATAETERMIDAAALAAMKDSAFLLNFARGSIVDETALIAALTDGTIAGAALDVFAVEPLPVDSPLWTLPNVIITPHLAGMSADYEERVVRSFLDNLPRFQRGEPLRNRVDLFRGY
jgi:phosphoglycerate dehydrogenase-like enzyme